MRLTGQWGRLADTGDDCQDPELSGKLVGPEGQWAKNNPVRSGGEGEHSPGVLVNGRAFEAPGSHSEHIQGFDGSCTDI